LPSLNEHEEQSGGETIRVAVLESAPVPIDTNWAEAEMPPNSHFKSSDALSAVRGRSVTVTWKEDPPVSGPVHPVPDWSTHTSFLSVFSNVIGKTEG